MKRWIPVFMLICVSSGRDQALAGDKSELVGQFKSAFYKDWPLFSTRADEAKAVQSIDRFGPVGIGIELHQPAFVMKVKNVSQVKTAKVDPKSIPFTKVTFKDGGETDSQLLIWTGDTLMNLDRNEVLKMTIKPENGTEYLFVESGGFSEKNPLGWKSSLIVLKRTDT